MKRLTSVLIILLAIIYTAPFAFGQINWTERVVDPLAIDGGKWAEPVDLDDDGDTDILGVAGNNVYFYENNGYQVFAKNLICDVMSSPEVRAVDLDGDGDLDAVAAAYGTDEIAWLENDGSQNFTYAYLAYLDGAKDPHVVDMDDDGDLDIVAVGYSDDKISWYENDGNQNFTEHVMLPSINGPYGVAVIDIDEDGDLDAFYAGYFVDVVGWLENDGSNNFTDHNIAALDGAMVVKAGDLDGDGDIDCAVGSYSAYLVNWYENDGSENFTEHSVALAIGRVRSIDVADLDNDTDLDIVVGSTYNDYNLYWFENSGTGSFTQNLVTYIYDPYNVQVGDIDSDGDPDIVVGNSYGAEIVWYDSDLTGAFPLTLTMTPASTPVTVPAAGGSFDYTLDVGNTGTTSYTVDLWIDVTLPVGTIYPILAREDITLTPGIALSRDMTQYVPGSAMPGIYSYNAHMRDAATWQVYLTDSFEFEKLETGDGIDHGYGWALFGWEEEELATAELPTEYAMLSVYPNPFNPTTTLSFALAEANSVELQVFDVSGSLVTTLVNGWREAGTHEVTFDASDLPSGVYIYTLQAGDFKASGKLILMK